MMQSVKTLVQVGFIAGLLAAGSAFGADPQAAGKPASTAVVPNSTRRAGSVTDAWSRTVVIPSSRSAGSDSVATSVAVGTP